MTRFLCLLFTAWWSMAVAGEDAFDLSAMNATAADHLILVTYRDRNIDRVPIAGHYRRRGPYRGSTWSALTARRLAEDYQLTEIAQWPITALGEHCVVYAVPQWDTAEILQALNQDPRIDSAQTMRMFHTRALNHQDPYFPLQENLHWLEIGAAHRLTQGREVEVALIDTAIDGDHPDLRPRIGFQRHFLKHFQGAAIHGTAMAGIIAAQADNRTGIVGVAPGVRLIALQACWPEHPQALTARCNTFTLALALNTAIRLHPKIINLSLTGPEDPLLRRLIRQATAMGIVVVAAEAEDGQPHFPASMEEVIAVRRLEIPVGDPFTRQHCLAAPGDDILTTFPQGDYNFVSGSSAATAQISGIIALMLELRPDLKVADIHRILRRSIRRQQGKTLINAHAAVQAVAQNRR